MLYYKLEINRFLTASLKNVPFLGVKPLAEHEQPGGRPDLHLGEPPFQSQAPLVGAEVHPVALHDRVERPHVDEVKKLGEELDSEGGIDPALPEQPHR